MSIPRSVRVASVVPEYAWSARHGFWIMSHQVQLSPAASHRPTAVLDPAGHAAKPPARRRQCPYSLRPDMRRIVSHLEIRSARPSFTPPPKIPGPARDRHGRTGPRGSATVPATVRWQARLPRRGKRREDTAGTWRAALHAEPSGQRPASTAHDRARPAGYPTGTCHRPPVDPRHYQAQASPNDHAAD
jgi:hypothetical protein